MPAQIWLLQDVEACPYAAMRAAESGPVEIREGDHSTYALISYAEYLRSLARTSAEVIHAGPPETD